METSEALKSVLKQASEEELEGLLRQVRELKEGDLKGLEEQVLKTVCTFNLLSLLKKRKKFDRIAFARENLSMKNEHSIDQAHL